MEASRFLPQGEPEALPSEVEGPNLELITGGLAMGQTVELVRTAPEMDFEQFKEVFHSMISGEEKMGAEEKAGVLEAQLAVRDEFSKKNGELSRLIHSLIQEQDLVRQKLIWTNGYIRDRLNIEQ